MAKRPPNTSDHSLTFSAEILPLCAIAAPEIPDIRACVSLVGRPKKKARVDHRITARSPADMAQRDS